MEKIDPLENSYSFRTPEGEKSKKKRKTRRRFSAIIEIEEKKEAFLSAEYIPGTRANLEQLLDAVHEAGEELKSSQGLENIKNYKIAVRGFLRYVVKNMLAVEERVSGRNILKRKRFTQIKVIDRKLERLAADIIQNQCEQVEILSRIDEINGLLLDLTT